MGVLSATNVLAVEPTRQAFRSDVLAGLSSSPKRLPCKYFYDRRGSMLFEAICALPEYYLTRAEEEIMQRHCQEMAAEIGERATLIEFGSGSSVKTRYLLEHLRRPAVYVPVDICREHLLETASRLSRGFPDIVIEPVCADFTTGFELPPDRHDARRRVVYFPGPTIGNFEPTGAVRLLNRIARLCGPGGGLLVGIDLVQDPATIERTYNDAAGVTAEFNLNLLLRINRELGGNFDLAAFQHLAFYDSRYQRMDIRLVSKRDQVARIGGALFRFRQGEPIYTQYAHKYTVDRFARLAREAGLKLHRSWTDGNANFSMLYLVHEELA
jgi:dimethylhistidine N-methyltransferase